MRSCEFDPALFPQGAVIAGSVQGARYGLVTASALGVAGDLLARGVPVHAASGAERDVPRWQAIIELWPISTSEFGRLRESRQSRKSFTCAWLCPGCRAPARLADHPVGFLLFFVSVSGRPPSRRDRRPARRCCREGDAVIAHVGTLPDRRGVSQIMLKPSHSQSACCVSGVSSASSGKPNLPPTDVADRRFHPHRPVGDVDHVRAPVGHQAAGIVVEPAEVEVEAVPVERPLRRGAEPHVVIDRRRRLAVGDAARCCPSSPDRPTSSPGGSCRACRSSRSRPRRGNASSCAAACPSARCGCSGGRR